VVLLLSGPIVVPAVFWVATLAPVPPLVWRLQLVALEVLQKSLVVLPAWIDVADAVNELMVAGGGGGVVV
jgi:hypothetical protein